MDECHTRGRAQSNGAAVGRAAVAARGLLTYRAAIQTHSNSFPVVREQWQGLSSAASGGRWPSGRPVALGALLVFAKPCRVGSDCQDASKARF